MTDVVAAIDANNWANFSSLLAGSTADVQRGCVNANLMVAWFVLGSCKPVLQNVYAAGYEVAAAMTCASTGSAQILRLTFHSGITSRGKPAHFEVFGDDELANATLVDLFSLGKTRSYDCLDGNQTYLPVLDRGTCQIAAAVMRLKFDATTYSDWDGKRPRGCFQHMKNRRVYFNELYGGGTFFGDDKRLCQKNPDPHVGIIHDEL